MPEDARTSAGFAPRVKDLPGDALAGTVNAVVSVPSGMATAAMAGVNPVYGLYATVFAPTVGGLFASSQLMQIATTGASALAAGQAIAAFPAEQRASALFLLVLLSGLFLVAFGLLGAGKLVRYVSYPVMTAFLSGVAAALVMDQSAQFAGYTSEASTSLGAFVDLLLHVDEFSWNAVLIGSIALVTMIVLGRTPLANIASLIALVVPSLVAFWWQPEGVEIVNDVSEIPSGFPPFAVPDLTMLSPAWCSRPSPSRSSSRSRAPASARPSRTPTAPVLTPPATCWPRALATPPPASSTVCRQVARSARAPSTPRWAREAATPWCSTALPCSPSSWSPRAWSARSR